MRDETSRRYAERRQLWQRIFAGQMLAGKVILDAGTGEGHFTRFLAEQNPGRLVSITCVPGEVDAARARLGPLAARIEFQIADLTRMPEIANATFEIVAGDFLVAAASGYAPFREIELLAELARVLRPGGTLILTGWELGEPPIGPATGLLKKLLRLREAVRLLAGGISFREHPRQWVASRLVERGLVMEQQVVLPDVHYDVSWLARQVEANLADVAQVDLRHGLGNAVTLLQMELQRSANWRAGVRFGQLYAVAATKHPGSGSSGPHPMLAG